MLPVNVRTLIADALYEVRHDPHHQLGEEHRLAIYQALNPDLDRARAAFRNFFRTRSNISAEGRQLVRSSVDDRPQIYSASQSAVE